MLHHYSTAIVEDTRLLKNNNRRTNLNFNSIRTNGALGALPVERAVPAVIGSLVPYADAS